MHADFWHTRGAYNRGKVPQNVVRIQYEAIAGTEHEVIILPKSGTSLAERLPVLVRAKGRHGGRANVNRALSGLRLRLLNYGSRFLIILARQDDNGLPNRKPARVEVDVTPSQSQRFTPP
jgi:hypothetical protein